MRLITSDDELSHAISKDMTICMQVVIAEIKQFVVNSVYDIVYKPYTALVTTYQRQFYMGGFYDSWRASEIEREGNMFSERAWESTIFSDPKVMYVDPYNYIHSNINWSGGVDDRRAELDAMIAEGYGYDFPDADFESKFPDYDYWWRKPRDYWSPILDLLDGNYMQFAFIEEMEKMGVVFWD